MTGTLTRICGAGLLSYFILISYFATASSMTLDLTELRNKGLKLKVNPRTNLWATGHFMGKKSVVDASFLESAFEDVNVPAEVRPVSPLRTVEDLHALLSLMLEVDQLALMNLDLKRLEETLLEEH